MDAASDAHQPDKQPGTFSFTTQSLFHRMKPLIKECEGMKPLEIWKKSMGFKEKSLERTYLLLFTKKRQGK